MMGSQVIQNMIYSKYYYLREVKDVPRLIDLSGRRFDKWEVIKRGENISGKPGWLCRCECGTLKTVSGSNLRSGLSRNCGCVRQEKLEERNTTHGGCGTRIYRIWCLIKERTTNKNTPAYRWYGERGISMCQEWQDFETFRVWAESNGYEADLTIDRIDNNGNYEPSNCRWVTQEQQANNTRKNRMLTNNGETHTVSEWARITGIKRSTISNRINRDGWEIEKALTTPV